MPPKKKKRKKAAASSRFSLFKALFWVSVVFLVGLTLFVALRLDLIAPFPVITPPAAQSKQEATGRPKKHEAEQSAPTGTSSGPETTAPAVPVPAYEAQTEDFDAKVRSVDLVILQALGPRASQDIMRYKTVEARSHRGQEFFYQNLTLTLGDDVFPFLADLKKSLVQSVPEATLEAVNGNPRDLEISVLGEPTHHIFLPLALNVEPQRADAPGAPKARLVIVIDDLGESAATARRLAQLPFKVSFSVLPHNTKAREVANIARQEELELLMHLPSEPDGYLKTADSGPGTLRVNMSPAVLERTLVDNLSRLPEVDGVNNHMGSRLTRDRGAMTVVLSHLKGRGKFFLDSLTTDKSCVRDVASKLGMRYYRRHIFLDNTAKEHAVLLQLRKAESLAKRTGVAVAIGHPYPATLSALEAWAKSRDMSVTVCRIQDI